MSEVVLSTFRERLYEEWLPSFCNADHRQYDAVGFKQETICNISEHDAHWFLKAIDLKIISEVDGYFMTPLSKAKEQIFWEGRKNKIPRPITLWVEPIITIGALAKLHEIYGWPINQIGAQSKTWAFDLVAYGGEPEKELLVCEVKKSVSEVDALIDLMKSYASDSSVELPIKAKERNAYKKMIGLRRSWPSVFWALGPDGYGKVYIIKRLSSERFNLIEQDIELLNHRFFNQS